MAVNKYFVNNAGTLTEQLAPGTSAGATDANKIPALDASGRLDVSFMPTGIGADTAVIQASEALTAGAPVNIHNVAGAFRVRLADATTAGKEADGFVLSAVASGANATVYFEGNNASVTGQVPGPVYLGTTAGTYTATAPSASGNVVQRLGVATSATNINFEAKLHFVLA
jgi:hypothetical protein